MESRQAPRFQLKLDVKIILDDSTKKYFDILKNNIIVEMLDISILGAGLLSKHFFPVGALLKLNFDLLFGQYNDQIEPINVSGEVRSAVSGGRGFTRIGVKFLDLTKEQKDAISRFIDEHERRKAPRLIISKYKTLDNE